MLNENNCNVIDEKLNNIPFISSEETIGKHSRKYMA